MRKPSFRTITWPVAVLAAEWIPCLHPRRLGKPAGRKPLDGVPPRIWKNSSFPETHHARNWMDQRVTGSANGKLLTFLRENTVSSVYVGALDTNGTHLLGNKKLTLDENQNLPFAWTPDSKAIFFSSNRNGVSEIYKQSTDQSLAENMMTSSEDLVQPRVSSDGSELLYISTPKSADLTTQVPLYGISKTWNLELSGRRI